MLSRFKYIPFIIFLWTSSLFAQQKVQFRLLGGVPFDGFEVYYTALKDFNNDSYPDLFAIYRNDQSEAITNIYLNDRNGHFSRIIPNQIIGVAAPMVDFGDIDKDGDLDFIIAGQSPTNSNLIYTRLYLNTGNGRFTLSTSTTFPKYKEGAVKFFDADNDSDLDIVISGNASILGRSCQLWLNNGIGAYQLKNDSILEGMSIGDIGVADIDMDGDKDLIISGVLQSSTPLKAFIYENDGSSNFTKRISNVDNHRFGEFEFFDADGDGDMDLTTNGYGSPQGPTLNNQLYLNDSLGNFSVDTSNNFFGHVHGTTTIIDIDKDGDEDILFSGDTHSGSYTGLYINQANGIFNLNPSLGLQVIGKNSDAADINQDGYIDVLVSGHDILLQHNSMIYLNDGNTNFKSNKGERIIGVQRSSVALAHINNDTLLDVFISGSTSNLNTPTTRYYLNNGNLIFNDTINALLNTVAYSAIAFADVDGDNDLDLFISGEDINNAYVANLYLNNGMGGFSVSSNPFPAVRAGSVIFHDVDNDADLDLFLQGTNSTSTRISNLYLNNGSGSYTLSASSFIGVQPTKSIFVDLENDGDDDLIISGSASGTTDKTFVYKNNGSGTFILDITNYNSIARNFVIGHYDVDNDGDEDILMKTSFGYNNFFRNNGSGILQGDNQFNSAFAPLSRTSSDHPSSPDGLFFDVDGDGDSDFLSVGINMFGRATSKLYIFDSSRYSLIKDQFFHNSKYGSVDIGDIDGDGRVDLLISGANDLNKSLSKIYLNRTCIVQRATVNVGYCTKFLSPTGKVWTQSGTYIDTIDSKNQCDSIITYILSPYQIDTTIVDSGSFLMKSSIGTVQWLDCSNNYSPIPGATNTFFYPPVNGTYAAEIREYDCIDTSSCHTIIATHISEFNTNDILVYPNPTKEFITIQIPLNKYPLNYQIYSIGGKLIEVGNITIQQNTISTRSWPKGMYMLKLLGSGFADQLKIIKD